MLFRSRVLHLAGREHRHQAGSDAIVVYASEPLDPDLATLHGNIALVHSPRAGAVLASRIADRSRIALVAISDAAAEAAGTGWCAVTVAARPRDAALIDAALRLPD